MKPKRTMRDKATLPCRMFALLLASALALALALPGRAALAEEIKVGMSAAFSGPSRGLGIELYRGSMAYLSKVNLAGGVHGNKITIIPSDDGYNPTPCIRNTIHFIEKDNVFCLFDYVGTPTVTRILPLLKTYVQRNAFLFFPFTGAQPQREQPYDRFVYNLRASYRQEIEGLVQNLLEVGRRRLGVLYQVDAYGRSGWGAVKRTLDRFGLRMAAEATYRRGATFDQSMSEQARIIMEAKPDAVVAVGAAAACAAFIRDARDMGLDVPICNVSFVDSENMLKKLLALGQERGRDYTANLINSQVVPSYEETSLPAVREYRALMDASPAMPPTRLLAGDYVPHTYSPVSLEGFLNAKMLVEILRRMGPEPRRRDIARTVESIRDYDIGINAPVRFGPERHQGLDVVFFTTVEDGRFVPLKDWNAWRK